MELRVIGCHGGETPKHRTSAFVVDDRIAIDAGSLTSGMELKAQCALEAVLVSHAHLDHVRDLATIADNRLPERRRAARRRRRRRRRSRVLKKHFFNGLLWPDFSKLPNAQARRPSATSSSSPRSRPRSPATRSTPSAVSHTIDTCAFTVRGAGRRARVQRRHGPDRPPLGGAARDRGPKALLMEVSFPNAEAQPGPRERPPHARDARART